MGRPSQGVAAGVAHCPCHLSMAMQGSGLQREAAEQQHQPHAEGEGAERSPTGKACWAAMDFASEAVRRQSVASGGDHAFSVPLSSRLEPGEQRLLIQLQHRH